MSLKLDRRTFVVNGALGAAGLALAGCDRFAGTKEGQEALDTEAHLNYAAAKTLPPGQLAPEYDKGAISAYFKPNGSIDPKAKDYKALVADKFASYKLDVGGLVEKPRSFTLADLRAMPARRQITRHDCVEGWSAIGQWTGVPLRELLDTVGVKDEARYVVFHCFDNYDTDYTTDTVDQDSDSDSGQPAPRFYGSIGMQEAVQPQTILAYDMNGDALPVPHGAPLRLRLERQLGYKNTKYIHSIELVTSFASIGGGNGGYWEDQGYAWYAGI